MELADNAPAAGAPEETPAPSEKPETPPVETPAPEPIVPTEPDVSTTKAFSERLNAKQKEWEQAHAQQSQTAIDAEYDRLFGREYGIHTKAEYDAAVAKRDRAQKAEADGVPVEYAERLNTVEQGLKSAEQRATTAEQRLAAYERREAMDKIADAFAQNPKYGAFFTANRADIMQFANTLDPTAGTPDQQLEFAVKQVLADKWEPPAPVDEAAIEERGVKKYLEKLKGQSHPVEGAGGGMPQGEHAIKDPWERGRAKAMAMVNGNTE